MAIEGTQLFFYASKLIGFFLQPLAFIAGLLVVSLVLRKTRFKRLAKLAFILPIGLLFAILFTPLSYWIMIPLEDRFPKPELPQKIAGIIVLGGGIDNTISSGRASPQYNAASDRMIEALRLAKLIYPNEPIIFSGGSNSILLKSGTEAEIARQFFDSNGVSSSRMFYEDKSRNTFENAVLSKTIADKIALLHSSDKISAPWLLITSAFHMPRSVGIFRKAGWNSIAPWPVDYRTRGDTDIARFPAVTEGAVSRTRLASREWIGLLAYWLSGKTDVLFPSP